MRVLILTDNNRSGNFDPLCINRPPCMLFGGMYTFLERWQRVISPDVTVVVTRNGIAASIRDERRLLVNSEIPSDATDVWILDGATYPTDDPRWHGLSLPADFIARDESGNVTGVRLSSRSLHDLKITDPKTVTDLNELKLPSGLGDQRSILSRIDYLWNLISINGELLKNDLHLVARCASDYRRSDSADQVAIINKDNVFIGSDVSIKPSVVLDASNGPIIIGDRSTIESFTRIEGPVYLGPDCTVTWGKITGGCSFGPGCKIGGEIEASIFLGFSNKVHEGFIGHGYLGEWVNLGAMTTNSDLKNTYGTVRVELADGPCESGSLKVGSFIADHVKTGIGTLLPTGCVLGLGVNYFAGGILAPKRIPPFVWGGPGNYSVYRLDKMISTAEIVMVRRRELLERHGRDSKLADSSRRLLEDIYESSVLERDRFSSRDH